MPLAESVVVAVESDAPDAIRLGAAEITGMSAAGQVERMLTQASATTGPLCYGGLVAGSDTPRARGAPARGATRVGTLVPTVLRDLGLDSTARAIRVLEVWDEALGPELAPHCRPEGLRHGVLWARVADSSWMQRIALEKPRILAALAEALGEPAASDLRLRIS